MTTVEAHHHQVFMSIFKGEVNARYEFKEKDFVQAMVAVGFKYSAQKKGSRRVLVPAGEAAEKYGCKPYVYHLHGKLVEKKKQDLIAKDLHTLYGWQAHTFVLPADILEDVIED